MGDDTKLVVAHDFDRALVLGQGVVEGDFVFAEFFLLAAPVGGADVLGEPDEFLKDLRRRDGVAVVTGDGFLRPLREGAGLHDVDPASRAKLPVDELAQRLHRQVLLLHSLNLGEEFVGQDGNLRVSSPAASRMSTISVETTARLTICCTARSRSAEDLPAPDTLLARAARTV